MTTPANANFSIKSWDEKTWEGKGWSEVEGPKRTYAKVGRAYTGDLEGEAEVQFLMSYTADGASYVGIEHFVGKLAGRSGTFDMQHTGLYANGAANSTFFIVPGSATGELVGLTGTGEGINVEGHPESYPISFKYDLPA